MDLQRLQALGATAVVLTGNPIGADALLLKAPKYQETGAASPSAQVDSESQWEILAYQFSGDTAGLWSFEDGTGGNLIGITHYYANNTISQLIECMLEMGKGKEIRISGAPSGKFSIVAYVVDRNYKNRKRLPLNT